MAAPRLENFTVLRCLGDGSSGEVHLVRENDTSGLYALKVIPKRKISGTLLAIETVMAERNLLLDLRGNDFILQVRACFHDSRNYYLVTVRDDFCALESRRSALSYSLLTAGISPCWRSPHLTIDEGL